MPPKKTAAKPTAPAAKVSKPAKVANAAPELALIRGLAAILNETGLSEIELDQKGTRVRVTKTLAAAASYVAAPAPIHSAPASPAAPLAPAAPPAPTHGDAEHAATVKSPMVGTVYLAPSPGSANFITEGAQVKKGQTLLIIEAMKTMNQIPAPASGKVTKIFVNNGDPVEYGAPLVAIE